MRSGAHRRPRARWALIGGLLVGACTPAAPPSPAPPPPAAAPSVVPPALGASGDTTGQVAPLPDPALPGPYAVGVTRRSLSRPSSTTGEPRTLDTVIWYPATPAAASLRRDERLGAPIDAEPERAGAPYPVVVQSGGSGGGAGGNTFLMTHVVSHGFIFVGVPHPGNTPGVCPYQNCQETNPEAAAWRAEAGANRLGDMRFALEALLGMNAGGDPSVAGLLDLGRMGTAGLSWGGTTAIQFAAEQPRLRAVLALAATGPPAARQASLAVAPEIRVPAFLLSGGLDNLAEPARQDGLFDAFAARSVETVGLRVHRTGHSMLLDWCPSFGYPECDADGLTRPEALPQAEAHARIVRWATAFLLHHVAGDTRYAALLDPALAAGDPEVRVTVAGGR